MNGKVINVLVVSQQALSLSFQAGSEEEVQRRIRRYADDPFYGVRSSDPVFTCEVGPVQKKLEQTTVEVWTGRRI